MSMSVRFGESGEDKVKANQNKVKNLSKRLQHRNSDNSLAKQNQKHLKFKEGSKKEATKKGKLKN